MSRNIGGTRCPRCGEKPKIVEESHPITESEAGAYFAEYEGMIVARAVCLNCAALFLAWVDERQRAKHPSPQYYAPTPVVPYYELSFHSSFNDEPGEGDLPPWTPPIVVESVKDAPMEVAHAYALVRDGSHIELDTLHGCHVVAKYKGGAWLARHDLTSVYPMDTDFWEIAKKKGWEIREVHIYPVDVAP